MNPIDALNDIKKSGKDDLIDIFYEDYKGMIETIQEVFNHNGYRLIIEKVKQ